MTCGHEYQILSNRPGLQRSRVPKLTRLPLSAHSGLGRSGMEQSASCRVEIISRTPKARWIHVGCHPSNKVGPCDVACCSGRPRERVKHCIEDDERLEIAVGLDENRHGVDRVEPKLIYPGLAPSYPLGHLTPHAQRRGRNYPRPLKEPPSDKAPLSPRPQWVGTERGILRSVSPSPPLSPCVRLSPHTATA